MSVSRTSPQVTLRAARAFTLVELMVASAIAAILVAAGAELASAMARNVKKSEEQSEIGVRGAIAHSFLQGELGSAAYNWFTPEVLTSTTDTGSFGSGNCAPNTGICALTGGGNDKYFPLRICRSSTVESAVCDDPVATEADAIMTYTPRDPLVEAVRIRSQAGGAPLDNGCGGGNPIAVQVTGKNSKAWASGDLVLVSRLGHSSVGIITTALAADITEPTGGRALTIDLGASSNTTGLGIDDGGNANGCNFRQSLLGASVMRIQQLIVKLDENAASPTFKNLLVRKRISTGDTSGFSPIISNVDDFQVRLDMVRITTVVAPALPVSSFCTSDTTAPLLGAAITACGGDRLNGDATGTTNSVRIVGMQLALVLRTAVQTELATSSIPFQFDRTGPAASDKRLRRVFFNYVGLPNASAF